MVYMYIVHGCKKDRESISMDRGKKIAGKLKLALAKQVLSTLATPLACSSTILMLLKKIFSK